ncbi:uncharacterized protein VK521_015454 [Ammospiza maritima maritima]
MGGDGVGTRVGPGGSLAGVTVTAEPEPEGSDDWLPGERRAVIGRFLESVASSPWGPPRRRGHPRAGGATELPPRAPPRPPRGHRTPARGHRPPRGTSGHRPGDIGHRGDISHRPGGPRTSAWGHWTSLWGHRPSSRGRWSPRGTLATGPVTSAIGLGDVGHRGDISHRSGDICHRPGDLSHRPGGHWPPRGHRVTGLVTSVIGLGTSATAMVGTAATAGDVIGGHRGDIAARIGRLQQAQLWSFPPGPVSPPPGSGAAPPPAGLEPAAPREKDVPGKRGGAQLKRGGGPPPTPPPPRGSPLPPAPAPPAPSPPPRSRPSPP